MDNVAQGMMNIGQAWATAPSPYLIPMTGTTGQTMVIPGIGGLPSRMMSMGHGIGSAEGEAGSVALFTKGRVERLLWHVGRATGPYVEWEVLGRD